MKKVTVNLTLILLVSFSLQVFAQTQPDEKLFYEARVLYLDMKWMKAQGKLEELLENYPNSPRFSQALYWKAKCLKEQRGKEIEALNTYKSYIEREDRTEILTEESETAIIELASDLYKRGMKSYLREIEKRLLSSYKVVRYYAAFELSYVRDKKVAARAIPTLKRIIEREDEELRDRAKIALLRIDPDALKGFEEQRHERKAGILNIRIYKKDQRGQKELEAKISIPWALADLALSTISEENKAMMRAEGYDLDRIRKELLEFRGQIIRFEDKETIIEIWID